MQGHLCLGLSCSKGYTARPKARGQIGSICGRRAKACNQVVHGDRCREIACTPYCRSNGRSACVAFGHRGRETCIAVQRDARRDLRGAAHRAAIAGDRSGKTVSIDHHGLGHAISGGVDENAGAIGGDICPHVIAIFVNHPDAFACRKIGNGIAVQVIDGAPENVIARASGQRISVTVADQGIIAFPAIDAIGTVKAIEPVTCG